jgi:DNA-binding transcriptional MerR regulator
VSTYRISELARRTGVSASTLRFYEQAGLLSAARTASGYRVYDEQAVRRLEFVGAAKLLGLPLEEIRDLLGCGRTVSAFMFGPSCVPRSRIGSRRHSGASPN